MDPRWGKGEGGMNWTGSTDTYTRPRVKQRASETLGYSTWSSAQCSVMTWEGKDEGWLGGRLQREGIYVYL